MTYTDKQILEAIAELVDGGIDERDFWQPDQEDAEGIFAEHSGHYAALLDAIQRGRLAEACQEYSWFFEGELSEHLAKYGYAGMARELEEAGLA